MNPTKINNIDVEYNYINHLDPNIFNNYSYTIVDNVINISGNGSQTSFTDFFGNSVIDTTQWQPVNNSLHHTGSIKKSFLIFFDNCIQRLAISGGETNTNVENYNTINSQEKIISAVGSNGINYATDILNLCDTSNDVNSFLGKIVKQAIDNGRGNSSGPVSELFQTGDTISFIIRCSGDGANGDINFRASTKTLSGDITSNTGLNTVTVNSYNSISPFLAKVNYTFQ